MALTFSIVPERCRQAETGTLVFLRPGQDSSEEQVGLADMLRFCPGCDLLAREQPCVRISFWEHCWGPTPAVLQLLLR